MCPQVVLTNFKTGVKPRKARPKGARLLATSTNSAPNHLIWEIPKGERL